jgi:hypothetical protein
MQAIRTGSIDPKSIALSAAMGAMNKGLAEQLNKYIPAALIPTAVGAVNQALLTGEIDPKKLAMQAAGQFTKESWNEVKKDLKDTPTGAKVEDIDPTEAKYLTLQGQAESEIAKYNSTAKELTSNVESYNSKFNTVDNLQKEYDAADKEKNALVSNYDQLRNIVTGDVSTWNSELNSEYQANLNEVNTADQKLEDYNREKSAFETPLTNGSDENFGLTIIEMGDDDNPRIYGDAKGGSYIISRNGEGDTYMRRIDSAFPKDPPPSKDELTDKLNATIEKVNSAKNDAYKKAIDLRDNQIPAAVAKVNEVFARADPIVSAAVKDLNSLATTIAEQKNTLKAIEDNVGTPKDGNLADQLTKTQKEVATSYDKYLADNATKTAAEERAIQDKKAQEERDRLQKIADDAEKARQDALNEKKKQDDIAETARLAKEATARVDAENRAREAQAAADKAAEEKVIAENAIRDNRIAEEKKAADLKYEEEQRQRQLQEEERQRQTQADEIRRQEEERQQQAQERQRLADEQEKQRQQAETTRLAEEQRVAEEKRVADEKDIAAAKAIVDKAAEGLTNPPVYGDKTASNDATTTTDTTPKEYKNGDIKSENNKLYQFKDNDWVEISQIPGAVADEIATTPEVIISGSKPTIWEEIADKLNSISGLFGFGEKSLTGDQAKEFLLGGAGDVKSDGLWRLFGFDSKDKQTIQVELQKLLDDPKVLEKDKIEAKTALDKVNAVPVTATDKTAADKAAADKLAAEKVIADKARDKDIADAEALKQVQIDIKTKAEEDKLKAQAEEKRQLDLVETARLAKQVEDQLKAEAAAKKAREEAIKQDEIIAEAERQRVLMEGEQKKKAEEEKVKQAEAEKVKKAEEEKAAAVKATDKQIQDAIAGIKFPPGITEEDVKKAVKEGIEANPGMKAADVAAEIAKYMKANPGVTAADVKGAIEDATKNVATKTSVSDLEVKLGAAIAEAKAAGLEGDAALKKGLEDLAVSQQTTAAGILTKMGKSEADIRTQFGKDIAGVAAQVTNLDIKLAKSIADAKAAGLEGDAALQSAINAVAADQKTSASDLLNKIGKSEADLKAQFGKEIAGVAGQVTDLEGKLSKAIADAKAAGLSGDAALKKAIAAVAASQQTTAADILNKMGKSEADLKAQFGKDIAAVSADVQGKFDALTEGQKGIVDAQVKQGKDLAQAIADVSKQTTGAIGDLSADVKAKFEALTEGQKGIVNAQVQQGKDLSQAIADATKKTEATIGDLSKDVQAKFDSLTQGQKDIVKSQVDQGKDLTQAINDVGTKLSTQITDTQAQFNARVDGLMAQGKTFQEATNVAIAELGTGISDIKQQQATDAKTAADKLAADTKAAADKAAADKATAAATAAKVALTGGLAAATSYLSANPSAAGTSSPVAPETPLEKIGLVTSGSTKEFESPLAAFMKKVKEDNLAAQPRSIQPQQGQNVQDNLSQQPTQEGQPQEQSDYFGYGKMLGIDDILNPSNDSGNFTAKTGGLVPPLMASGGTTRYGKYAGGGLNVINHEGKNRVDFRSGDAVTGAGDGQSDDIPAMLADGEFVFPADVVSALGNGSTKAGSDKLYDMMHSIRQHSRSSHPKDLPPPAKSPLQYLKGKARR